MATVAYSVPLFVNDKFPKPIEIAGLYYYNYVKEHTGFLFKAFLRISTYKSIRG